MIFKKLQLNTDSDAAAAVAEPMNGNGAAPAATDTQLAQGIKEVSRRKSSKGPVIDVNTKVAKAEEAAKAAADDTNKDAAPQKETTPENGKKTEQKKIDTKAKEDFKPAADDSDAKSEDSAPTWRRKGAKEEDPQGGTTPEKTFDYSEVEKELGLGQIKNQQDLISKLRQYKSETTKNKHALLNDIQQILDGGGSEETVRDYFGLRGTDYLAKNSDGTYKVSNDDVVRNHHKEVYGLSDDEVNEYIEEHSGTVKFKIESMEYRKAMAAEQDKRYNDFVSKIDPNKGAPTKEQVEKQKQELDDYNRSVDEFATNTKDYDGVPLSQEVTDEFAKTMKTPGWLNEMFINKDGSIDLQGLFRAFVHKNFELYDKEKQKNIEKDAKKDVYKKSMNYDAAPDKRSQGSRVFGSEKEKMENAIEHTIKKSEEAKQAESARQADLVFKR